MLVGGAPGLMKDLQLTAEPEKYFYLNQVL